MGTPYNSTIAKTGPVPKKIFVSFTGKWILSNKKSYCRPRKENRRYEEKQKMHFGAGFILATLAALTVGAKLPSAGLSKRAKTDPRTFFAILGRGDNSLLTYQCFPVACAAFHPKEWHNHFQSPCMSDSLSKITTSNPAVEHSSNAGNGHWRKPPRLRRKTQPPIHHCARCVFVARMRRKNATNQIRFASFGNSGRTTRGLGRRAGRYCPRMTNTD